MNYKNQDCLDFLKTIEDNSIDLICTDPPYYRVVNDGWDNQWFTVDEYYKWCEEWIKELGRVAKWSCSFWIFGYPKQLCRILPIIEKCGFTFRQQIVISKGMRSVAGRTSDKLKMYPTATESAFFFHYESRNYIRDLLQSETKRLNWKGKDFNGFLGKATTGGGTFSTIASEKKPLEHRVYPTKSDWDKLRSVMNLPKYDDVVYTFNLQRGLIDVWDDINFYDKSEPKFHSTQKPLSLIQRIVETSSNEGHTVLDIFGGSGSTGVVCKNTGRNFVGCEIDKTYFEKSLDRINKASRKNKSSSFFE